MAMARTDKARVVVATTVLLSFISFWRAAAIVLSDLASSAFYVGGIAEEAVGKSAPWFILSVMLFSYAVRAVYVESCAMFTRGGVYRVVKEAMGRPLAKLSVSALMFDYILTGPISGVSAGQYLAGLMSDTLQHFRGSGLSSGQMRVIAVGLALAITLYFWRQNIKGMHESSERALRIMQVTTVMVVLVIAWCVITVAVRGAVLPPLPTDQTIRFSDEALGWLNGTRLPNILPIAILIGFGHSILAMSGEESLAQVNREIEHPKIKNLRRAGLVIFIYSLVFTSLVSFFAVMLIPDQVRSEYFDNLIGGLAMYVVGPAWMKLLLQGFVVFVGFLILAGAVNTAIVGSNGVLNRVSEDGVLSDWFRAPHHKFGTTYRIIDLVVMLQIVTILISGGRVYVLGEAYAFGVIWSFAFKALAVLVLRFTEPGQRSYRVPFNVRVGRLELPVGLGLITVALFAIAGTNLLTKQVATISGLAFTGVFFALFTFSERRAQRRRAGREPELDQFQLVEQETAEPEAVGVRPGSVLVPVRNGAHLRHLEYALEQTDTTKQDVVVVSVKVMRGSSGAERFYHDEIFGTWQQLLFTKVVAVAERLGRPVSLLVVPSIGVFPGIAWTAFRLNASRIILGQSHALSAEKQSQRLEIAWAQIPGSDRKSIVLEVVGLSGQVKAFRLGAHEPQLSEEDLNLIHQLWLSVSQQPGTEDIHHRDIVVAGLRLLKQELDGPRRTDLIGLMKRHDSGR
ncbi:MAG: APC family permease [Acidobacteriota bacterium]|nr:APC family permease [Blastocatellia bacterium]MDW8238220.1 APC family permease [Acidobacteriota bacterium]